jgi:hypothetical protein
MQSHRSPLLAPINALHLHIRRAQFACRLHIAAAAATTAATGAGAAVDAAVCRTSRSRRSRCATASLFGRLLRRGRRCEIIVLQRGQTPSETETSQSDGRTDRQTDEQTDGCADELWDRTPG